MQSPRNVHGESLHAGWVKPLATIFLLLSTFAVSLGPVTTYAVGGQVVTVDLPVEMDTVKIDTEFYPDGEGGYLYAGYLDGYGVLETAIKFDISELSSNIHSTELSLHVSQHEAQSYLQFWGSEDNDWSEVVVGHGFPTSIDDETGPIHTLDQQNGFGVGRHNIDITDYFLDNQAGDDKATFVITGNDTVTSGNTLVYLYPRNTGLTDRVTYLRVTYTPESGNADLSNLTLSAGTLDPAFGVNTLSYTSSVGNEVSSIVVTPTVDDGAATVTVAGEAVVSGNASAAIVLDVGANWVPVEVTAEDGTLKTYTITVTRAQSSNADLSNLVLSEGALSPVFGANITSYEAAVGNHVSSVTVTPTTDDGVATVEVDGVGVVSGNASLPIALDPGDNPIPVAVTAQDGITKTYTITVYDGEAPGILSLTGPENNATNQAFDVTVIFNEPVENFTTAGVAVSNGSAESVTEVAPDEFTVAIAPDTAGPGQSYDIDVQIEAGAVQDLSGNDNEASSVLTIAFDTTELASVITSEEDPGPTNAPFFEATITFNKPVWGFALGGITPANAALSGFAGSDGDSTFTLTVTPDTDGEVTLDVAAGVAQDVAGNDNTGVGQFSIVYDVTAPNVTISSSVNGPTNADPIPVSLEFSEDVTDFVVGDIAVSGGTLSNFSGSGTSYSVDVTPSGDGTITVDVPADVAEDAAGNGNTAATQFSIVYDGTAPSVTISSTESSPTNADPIPVDIGFSEDVTGFAVGDIVVSGGTLSNFSGSGTSYSVDVTPSGDGTITVDAPADGAEDAAGNGNSAADPFIIVHDETPPTVTVSSVYEITSIAAIPVTVQFSETVTGFTASDIDVVNGSVDPASFVDVGMGEFTVAINPDDTDPGLTYDIVISIPAAAAEDLAGNFSEASAEDLVIAFDSVAPGVVISADQVNEFGGELYTNADAIDLTIVFDQPVWGFGGAGIDIVNATWSDFTGGDGDTAYNVTIDPPPGTGPELITVNIDAGVAEDDAGNGNTVAAPLALNWDQNRPTPVISSTSSDVTGDSPIPVVIDFGKPVQAFTLAMAEAAVSSDGGATFSILDLATEDSEVFTFILAPDADDVFSIALAEAVVLDRPGNENLASNTLEVTFDTERPVASFHAVEEGGVFADDPIDSPTGADFFTLYVSFSKPVIDFDDSMLEQSNAILSDFTEVDAVEGLYSVRVEAVDDGEVSVLIADGVVQDEAGNDNQEAEFTIESDRTAPEVAALEATIDPTPINPGFTNVASFEVQLQFSKPMTDFDVAGLIVENASVVLLDEDNQQHFTLEVTADSVTDSAHTVSVEVPQGGFTDEAGNALGNSETFAIEFGDVRPTAQFTTSTVDPSDQEPIAVTLTFTEIFGEEVSGFDVDDIVTENVAHIEWVGGTNPVFELEVTPEGFGNFGISLSLPEGAVSDIAGNESEPSGVFDISVTHGLEPIPVPIAGPFGLVILVLMMLALAMRRDSPASFRT